MISEYDMQDESVGPFLIVCGVLVGAAFVLWLCL